mmetsp:Transcript_19595/g.22499  ORF Transcript_19595/g.22499 Transcript_19595/m.22499 type:complete len:325 (-) Transcript_19595:230-1204(-)
MTQGRFDTVHNCRPHDWDVRRHWTNWSHNLPCEKDHQERESCPFHDLRAGGQFQYEYWGSGVGGHLVEPHRLNERSAAKHMLHGKGKGDGIGGSKIMSDAEPGRPQESLGRAVDCRPWSHVSRLRGGLFSSPEYIPQGPPLAAKKRLPQSRAFSSGSKHVPYLNEPITYVQDKFNDKIDPGRVYHLKAGKAAPIPDTRIEHHPCPPLEPVPHRHDGPFYAGKSLGSTFNGPTKQIPEPYDGGKIRNDRRPLHTWYTHSKWSMPVRAPWSTGKVTAEPIRGENVGTSLSHVPAVANHDVSQTIGREAALSTLQKPGAAQFGLSLE